MMEKLINKTFIYNFGPPWVKTAPEQERGPYSSWARWSLFTIYGHVNAWDKQVSITVCLSWILIFHETLSCLWLHMKGSLGVTAKECKTCLSTFLRAGHVLLFDVLTGIGRPGRVWVFHWVDNVVWACASTLQKSVEANFKYFLAIPSVSEQRLVWFVLLCVCGRRRTEGFKRLPVTVSAWWNSYFVAHICPQSHELYKSTPRGLASYLKHVKDMMFFSLQLWLQVKLHSVWANWGGPQPVSSDVWKIGEINANPFVCLINSWQAKQSLHIFTAPSYSRENWCPH